MVPHSSRLGGAANAGRGITRVVRDDLGVSIIYITHDLATAYYISDRVIIMKQREVVENRAGETRVDALDTCGRLAIGSPRAPASPQTEELGNSA